MVPPCVVAVNYGQLNSPNKRIALTRASPFGALPTLVPINAGRGAVLSQEHNDLLTHVGAGTPTGELFRHYWMPLLLTEELTAAVDAPVRVRVKILSRFAILPEPPG